MEDSHVFNMISLLLSIII